MDKLTIIKIQQKINILFKIYDEYSSILNSYVLDFYVNHQWDKLPQSWCKSLENLEPSQIAQLLNYDQKMTNKIWPLSILALKTFLVTHSLPRKPINLNIDNPLFTNDEKLMKLFWKNVKAKKRHEISLMSKLCYETAKETNCFVIIDIGSGLGHLSRMLNYGFGMKTCTIEAQATLSNQAEKLDAEFERVLVRKFRSHQSYTKTVHLTRLIRSDITASDFLEVIKSVLAAETGDFSFGIVGLHPCGDLGATLLRLYTECPNAKFVNTVGCCFMKLTTLGPNRGFPLSRHCQASGSQLAFHSREIACHAIENYTQKLENGECAKLKIHAFRAALEQIIVQIDPNLRHSAVSNVKYSDGMDFRQYCHKATRRLGLDVADERIDRPEVEAMLNDWKKVVVCYSLRLLLAPLVETIILLDRALFLKEAGHCCDLRPVFDPIISPRNHVLTSKKP